MAPPPKRPNPFDKRTTSVGPDKEFRQIGFALPKFYMRVLEGEAAFLKQRRSQILEMLVLRKAGLLRVERVPSAPKYRVKRDELLEVERYIWHCRTEIKEHLDRLRERMGAIPPRTWVMLALNEWIGLPSGVGDLK